MKTPTRLLYNQHVPEDVADAYAALGSILSPDPLKPYKFSKITTILMRSYLQNNPAVHRRVLRVLDIAKLSKADG